MYRGNWIDGVEEIANVKCQSLPAFGGAIGDQGSNDKKMQVTVLLDLGFWHSFDIWILAFGFFFAPVLQYSIIPVFL